MAKKTSLVNLYLPQGKCLVFLILFRFIILIDLLIEKWASNPKRLNHAERFIYNRKSVLYLLKRMFHARLSSCSTDLRQILGHSVNTGGGTHQMHSGSDYM